MRVIFAYDGSEPSKAAMSFAAKLLQVHDEIYLVHVIPDILQAGGILSRRIPSEGITGMAADFEEKGHRILSEAAALLKLLQRKSTSHVLRGHAVEQICRFSDDMQGDVIIMGRRGLNPIKRFLLGSVSDGILHQSSRSVLLGPNHCEQTTARTGLTVLLGCDHSPLSLRAIDFVKQHLKQQVQRVNLVHVLPADFGYGMAIGIDRVGIHSEIELAARQALNDLGKKLAEALPAQSISYDVVTDTFDVSTGLTQEADRQQADLVVVGSTGHSTFHRMMVGSVAHKLAQHAKQSLLVVR